VVFHTGPCPRPQAHQIVERVGYTSVRVIDSPRHTRLQLLRSFP
jgi:hypothetical protein